MSFGTILSTLLIGPLKLVFEVIFTLANKCIDHPGYSIILLSLAMNILVLPLYRQADALQEKARDQEAKLRDGIAHIKKTFSGDERMMILQTYYRQNNYSPLSALSGSVSLLLQIPFFMAAYQFLSELALLNGVSLGPITDLSKPDGLIPFAGHAINFLPILMTLINVISSAIYLKGFPFKTKLQLYAMAGLFLVLLYDSPAGLVFYWTLNNLFSLGKTIFYKLKKPKKAPSAKRPKKKERAACKPNKTLFLLGGIFMTVLTGLFIPSTFIAASPQEFIDLTYFHHPLWYIVSSLCFASGTFIVWLQVFYKLANDKGKVIFDRAIWILSLTAIVNYMFFGTDLGTISSTLQYDDILAFYVEDLLINGAVVVAIGMAAYFIVKKWNKAVPMVLLVMTIALSAMSGLHIVNTANNITQLKAYLMQNEQDNLIIPLSKTGKNVVVIMLDRAGGALVPYVFNEKPELKEQFDGFVHYDNTISFGSNTNYAAPAAYGGYEYTPIEFNKRDQEYLVEKHNEALKVLPCLFSENGFVSTSADPVYAGYNWIPDLSIFDDYPEIHTFSTEEVFEDISIKEQVIANTRRNFFCFSLMKSMPLCFQETMYDGGMYNQAVAETDASAYATQVITTSSTATGMNPDFIDQYNVLDAMPRVTTISDGNENTFCYLYNDCTHSPTLLQTPDYVPSVTVDNTAYDAAHIDRFTVDGYAAPMTTIAQMSHYDVFMAAFLKLGTWFDYLRENGVYDNTRIILVSDHGYIYYNDERLIQEDRVSNFPDMSWFYPLLMVKDFNATGLSTSHEFMTNADVPTLATTGLIEEPVNPFTGNVINNDEKYAHKQFIARTDDSPEYYDPALNDGVTFLPSCWATVSDDIWVKENWDFYDDQSIALDRYSHPSESEK